MYTSIHFLNAHNVFFKMTPKLKLLKQPGRFYKGLSCSKRGFDQLYMVQKSDPYVYVAIATVIAELTEQLPEFNTRDLQ